MANEPELHLTFTAQRLDYIANVLAQRPWSEVNAILQDIQQQIARQQAAPVAAVKPNGHDTRQPMEH